VLRAVKRAARVMREAKAREAEVSGAKVLA
jgi:hypothetical protein